MLRVDHAEVVLGTLRFHFNILVGPQESLVVLGESGSGKSTLLNLIGGFVPLTAGAVTWKSQRIDHLPPDQRPIATLFQRDNLFDHLSVYQNIGLGLNARLKLDATQRRAIDQVLDEVGLPGFHHRLPDALSGGEQQRVALARSLLMDRPVLLLDEPYSALDMDNRERMLVLTRRVVAKHRRTLVMVSHDPADADSLGARRVTIIDHRLDTIGKPH